MGYYVLHFIRIIIVLIIEVRLNQYVPIVKIINSTSSPPREVWKRTPMQYVEKLYWLINKYYHLKIIISCLSPPKSIIIEVFTGIYVLNLI